MKATGNCALTEQDWSCENKATQNQSAEECAKWQESSIEKWQW
jgi:hypothetical protein